MKNKKQIVNFLFETGILGKTPRSGFYFLGSGEQSVAEHISRVIFIGYTLSQLEPKVNKAKVLQMCLLHDLHESRTSDLNYVHRKYTKSDENRATKEIASTLPFGDDLIKVVNEFEQVKSLEAKLAKDADQIEMILSLKEQVDIGNTRAKTWLPSAIRRLQTRTAKELAREIVKTSSDNWWFANKKDSWWINKK